MGFWTNKQHRTGFDDAEDLAYAPSGGCVKMWLLGVGLALIPLSYGVHCLLIKHARLWGRRGSYFDLEGSSAIALGIAYVALGVFIHFHWFWGLNQRLERFSHVFKLLAAATFLGSLGFAIYKIIAA